MPDNLFWQIIADIVVGIVLIAIDRLVDWLTGRRGGK
jgi:hypothetical protein